MITPQENFSQWMAEHYEWTEADPPAIRCRRCGKEVGYLTKHAVVRHGDPIEVMPVTGDHRDLAEAY